MKQKVEWESQRIYGDLKGTKYTVSYLPSEVCPIRFSGSVTGECWLTIKEATELQKAIRFLLDIKEETKK